jgi:hypothetical protein
MDVCRNECLSYGVQGVIQKLPSQLTIRSYGVTSALEKGRYGHNPFRKSERVSNARERCATRVPVSLMNVLPKSLNMFQTYVQFGDYKPN